MAVSCATAPGIEKKWLDADLLQLVGGDKFHVSADAGTMRATASVSSGCRSVKQSGDMLKLLRQGSKSTEHIVAMMLSKTWQENYGGIACLCVCDQGSWQRSAKGDKC
eukprot:1928305-Amphidinium_carterae.1